MGMRGSPNGEAARIWTFRIGWWNPRHRINKIRQPQYCGGLDRSLHGRGVSLSCRQVASAQEPVKNR